SIRNVGSSVRNVLQSLKYRSLTTSYDPSILKAFSDFVAKQRLLDAILLTGDIATTGDYGDLVRAHQFIEGRCSGAWFSHYPIFPDPPLSRTETPILLLPGNHDRLDKTGKFFEP